jgi:hypothetical protein
MTDFRALCAELVEKLDELNCNFNIPNQSALIERAYEALAQPEPQGPTDEEIMELMPRQMRDDLATAARALSDFAGPKASTVCRIILNRHAVDHVRAVLAKCGKP